MCCIEDVRKILRKHNCDLQYSVWASRSKSFFAISIDFKDDHCLKIEQYMQMNHDNNKIHYKPLPIIKKKWIEGAINSAYVLNKSQDWLFIFGGMSKIVTRESTLEIPQDWIIAFDLNKKEFYNCSIHCPFEGPMYAISMINSHKDKLLVFGFVHDLYRNDKWKNLNLCPDYLIKLMKKYVVTEYIHILGQSKTHLFNIEYKHFKINIDKLIRSVICEDD